MLSIKCSLQLPLTIIAHGLYRGLATYMIVHGVSSCVYKCISILICCQGRQCAVNRVEDFGSTFNSDPSTTGNIAVATPLGSTMATMASPAGALGACAATSCKVRPETAREAGCGFTSQLSLYTQHRGTYRAICSTKITSLTAATIVNCRPAGIRLTDRVPRAVRESDEQVFCPGRSAR